MRHLLAKQNNLTFSLRNRDSYLLQITDFPDPKNRTSREPPEPKAALCANATKE